MKSLSLGLRTDPSLYHCAIFSDSVIVVSVVVNSIVKNAEEPWKHIFHVITDRMHLAALKVWFKMRPVEGGAFVEVKAEENETTDAKHTKSENTKHLSMLNHLKYYFPETYPKLHKILFLDDDVVVQKDLTALWRVDLDGKVNGAVETSLDHFIVMLSI
nr:probable galacturonosyltransferase 9 [Tanacetum cinerariifolium]